MCGISYILCVESYQRNVTRSSATAEKQHVSCPHNNVATAERRHGG